MQRSLSLIVFVVLILIVGSSAQAQAPNIIYTEEFIGHTLEPKNIGTLGWNIESAAEPGALPVRVFRDFFPSTQPIIGNVGFLRLSVPPGNRWGALVLGTIDVRSADPDKYATIPRLLQNEQWTAEFTFAISYDTRQSTMVGLFRPEGSAGTDGITALPVAGCYVRYGPLGDFDDFTKTQFKYVCYDNGATIAEVDSGVVPDFTNYDSFYTLRIRWVPTVGFRMSLTKAGGSPGVENPASVRTLNFRSSLSQDLVPAFIASQGLGDNGAYVVADYFHFSYPRIRR